MTVQWVPEFVLEFYIQVIYLPCIPVQEILYYRQLGVNNFSIHNLGTDKTNLYQYHEGLATKSPMRFVHF